MADDRKWVVLVQKVPRGPMDESEIQALLQQRLITHNDLAFLISIKDPRAPSEWKFLWQFSEFDRRKPRPDGQPDQMAVKYAAVRKPISEEEIKRRAKEALKEALPLKLIDISPSDLLPHITSEFRLPTERELGLASSTQEEKPLLNSSWHFPWGWTVTIGVTAALFFFVRSMNLRSLFSFKSPAVSASHGSPDQTPEHPQMSFGTPHPVRGQASLPTARPPEPMKRPPPPEAEPESDQNEAAEAPAPDEAPPAEDADTNANAKGEPSSNNGAANGTPPAEGNQQNAEPAPQDNRQPAEQPKEEDPETKRALDNFLGGM